jgi:aryl-alcohol dehydrogenase
VQTGAQSVLNILRPAPGQTLAVFGAGGVGLSAVIAAVHLTGATVAVVDVNPARLALAERLGATHVINGREQDAVAALREITSGRGVDRTLEATGVVSVLEQAIDVLAPLGVCGIVGAPAPDANVSMNVLTAIVKGSSVVGINQGDSVPRETIPALVELHRQGRFPFDELIKVYPFEDIQQAADDAAAGKVVKPVLRMPEATSK